jgi:hypothetical protein
LTIKTLYQTLEDRDDDLAKLEANGPYPCHWENTWLGNGYYFWDTFIENAHWWGSEIRQYDNGYIICKAICDYNEIECCDLVGNTEHLQMFNRTFEFLKDKGLVDGNTKVKRLIQYLKEDIKTFHFIAIRAYGIKSKNFHSKFCLNMFFENRNAGYMDFKPAIQICLYKKTSMNLRNYKIAFPDEYIDGYLV